MRNFAVTTEGQQLAAETGLEELASRLYNKDYDRPLNIIGSLIDDSPVSISEVLEEDIEKEVLFTRSTLKNPEECAKYDKAFFIDPEVDMWRIYGEDTDNGLFPIPTINNFTAATAEDSLVLSGAAGLSLVNFRNHYPLLSRSRFAEYGFDSYVDACAFVGAFIVGCLIEKDETSFRSSPSFDFNRDGIKHTVSVGGTFHGDFLMIDTQSSDESVISPINTLTKFSPLNKISVGGYHSVEPIILASIFEAEVLNFGIDDALLLIDEFNLALAGLNKLSERNKTNESPFVVPPFADFGDGDIKNDLIPLQLLLTCEDYRKRAHGAIFSAAYQPQSNIMFEILPTEKGVRFQNNSFRQEDSSYIDVDRENFVDLFRALMKQTIQGLGRTSPTQLINLVQEAKALLLENR